MDGVDVDVTALEVAAFGEVERSPSVQDSAVVECHQLAGLQSDLDRRIVSVEQVDERTVRAIERRGIGSVGRQRFHLNGC